MIICFRYITFAMLLLVAGCTASGPPEITMMVGGVQINEADTEQWVSTVKDAGLNTVEVTVYGRNGDWDSKWMKFEEEEPYVLKEIRAARGKGLKVVLILRMALDHYYPANKFLWHGMIFPRTEADLAEWFQTYRDFVAKWAVIAEEEEIDALVIGSELNALASTVPVTATPQTIAWFADSTGHRLWEERVLRYADQIRQQDLWVRGFPNYEEPRAYIRDKVQAHWEWAQKVGYGLENGFLDSINARRKLLLNHWRTTIHETRELYSGLLSYAANFDNYHEVAFWDELDFIGINAYFPLSDPVPAEAESPPDGKSLTERWKSVLSTVDAFRLEHELMKKPVVFTELGYTYRKHATVQPWKSTGFSVVGKGDTEQVIVWEAQPVDRSIRLQAVKALYNAVVETRFPLTGILYWKLTGTPELVPIEPFALHIAPSPTDSLQVALSRFLELPPVELE